ncbi:hypothetical protein SK128_026205, partial [Halocaridina rubra]
MPRGTNMPRIPFLSTGYVAGRPPPRVSPAAASAPAGGDRPTRDAAARHAAR